MAATEVDRLSLATHTGRSVTSSVAFPSSRMSKSQNPLKAAVEIIGDRLYYIALKTKPPQEVAYKRNAAGRKKPIHYFCIDNELVYWNFFLDFGPLNLGQLYRFCMKLNDKLKAMPEHMICFYSSNAPAKRANAICLICCWQVLYLHRTPEEAFHGFRVSPSSSPGSPTEEHFKGNASAPPLSRRANPTLSPLPLFHDASPCACTYELTVFDCLRGLAKARKHNFFDFDNFDIEEYEHFEQVENGDLNWIVYGKILAFAGPSYERRVSPEGYCTLAPAEYIPYFKENNVSLVVRLNRKAYNEEDFRRAGIDHVEHFYVDGSCPPIKILDQVIEAFERVPEDKAFAVHCKAGLGRTGTCIGAYLMKHYRFTASEVIAWMRICRPGCVIGPQQQFLKEIEQRMWQAGEVKGSICTGKKLLAGLAFQCGSNASANVDQADEAVTGQAEGLLNARRNKCGKSKNAATPPRPESTMGTKLKNKVVTPDPPGQSKCDGGRYK